MDTALSQTEINKEEMKKPLEVWHLFVGIAGVLVACWGIVYMANKDNVAAAQKVENHEVRLTQLENDRQELKNDIKEIKQSQEQMLIILQNKQDRK